MTTTTRDAVGLAATWRLLALGFTAPTAETLAEVEVLAEAVLEADASPELEAVLQTARSSGPVEAAAQYSALFRGKVLVAPYEGSYEVDPIRQGRQMADVAAFYRAFGAEAHGPGTERPDFVGCELEFLSFLELRRLVALDSNEEGAEIIDDIRDSFLADHAGRWLPTFFGEVRTAAENAPLYRRLAELGACVLAEELARRDVTPAPVPLRRRAPRSDLDADSVECGSAGAPTPLD